LNSSKIHRYELLIVLLILPVGVFGFTYFRPDTSQPLPVDIHTDCSVSLPERQASIDQEVIWNAPDKNHQYSADFGSRSPFSTYSVPAGSPRQVQSTDACNRVSVYAHPKTCYFAYSVFKDGKSCLPDPGVRVVPPDNLSFYIILAIGLLGISTYFIFLRTRLRKRASSLK
jgi:hypothetical protein